MDSKPNEAEGRVTPGGGTVAILRGLHDRKGWKPSGWMIAFRYGLYLLHEFRWPLLVFWTLVLVGGLVLAGTYVEPHDYPDGITFSEGCYAIFMMIFLESYLHYPPEWFLQPLFFIIPIIGLGAVADSLIRLAFLTFSSKQSLPEWHQMVASLFRDHVVVVGLGKVGYEIVQNLLALGEPVVVIERASTDSTLLEEVMDRRVPVIRGDGRTAKVLRLANVQHARAVVLATSDDLANLDAGLTARDLNDKAAIVLRLFDESLAAKVRSAFAIPAISTARVAAPAFVAAATGRQIYQDFELGGRHVSLIDLRVCPGGGLVGMTVGQVQAGQDVNVVMHRGPSGVNVNPGHEIVLGPDDEMLIIAPQERLMQLESLNKPRPATAPLRG